MSKKTEILVFEKAHKPFTTSLDIAEKFNKRHDHVIRAIENLMPVLPNSNQCFGEMSYRDFYKREQKMYGINRDGFTYLAMGFTGKKALDWKIKYVTAFNAMQEVIEARDKNLKDAGTQLSRIEGKITRRTLTDIIEIFVEYARKQGSSKPQMYYQVISKLSNRLFEFNDSIKKSSHKRDYMESAQLNELKNIEEKLAQTILMAMEKKEPYKSIYLLCKDKVERYIEIFGTSPVIAQIEQTQYTLLN